MNVKETVKLIGILCLPVVMMVFGLFVILNTISFGLAGFFVGSILFGANTTGAAIAGSTLLGLTIILLWAAGM